MSTHQPHVPDPLDRSSPTLLIVSLVTVLAGVAGVIAVALTDAAWVMFATLIVLLVGLVIVVKTMTGQLSDDGDDR